MSALGKEVRRKRVEKHMSIGDLAEATGAHPNMISRIERGYIPATGVWIPAIEKALDVSSGLFGRAYESDFADGIFNYNRAEVGARYRRKHEN